MFPIKDTIPTRKPPLITWLIIGINVIIFMFELSVPRDVLNKIFYIFGVVPARYSHPQWAMWLGLRIDDWWPFVTSMFLHGGWMHLISNMWTLWIFGDNVEDRMGHLRFFVFYLLSGIIAGLVHFIFNYNSTIPTVGASGAIAGVLGAYMVLFPRANIITLVPIFFYPMFIAIPAVFYLFVWFFSQFLSGLIALASPSNVGGVAWWAHIGGFVFGLIVVKIFVRSKEKYYYFDEFGYRSSWNYY